MSSENSCHVLFRLPSTGFGTYANERRLFREETAYTKGLNMLVLSRQRDETIMIGDDIEVTVVDIRGDKVRLGIKAPKQLSVHRKEVYDAIRRENRATATVKKDAPPT